jgi:maleate isomerase
MLENSNYQINKLGITNEGPIVTPKVGMIILDTDLTCERDFARLKAERNSNFDLYYNRVAFKNPMTVESLREILIKLPEAAESILPGVELDALIFNCTSSSALLGDDAVMEAIPSKATHIMTTASASVAEMKNAKAKNVSMLCPYPKNVSIGLADYFYSCGINVTSLTYLDVQDDRDVANISAEQIISSALKAIDKKSDSLFISCTALRSAEIVDTLINKTKKKIFTSNYSTFMHLESVIGKNQ